MSTSGRHDSLVEKVYERLVGYGTYDGVWKETPYKVKNLEGCIDVLAIRTTEHGTYVHAYEVKSVDGVNHFLKAFTQLTRFKTAMGQSKQHIRGVYITPKRVWRLKL